MKKTYIVSYFLLLRLSCLACDKGNPEDREESYIHNHIITSTYENVEVYSAKKYVIELLSVRLNILHNYLNKLQLDSRDLNRSHYKNLLLRNENTLRENMTSETLKSLTFYNGEKWLSLLNHTLDVSDVLQELLGDKCPQELDEYISKLHSVKENMDVL